MVVANPMDALNTLVILSVEERKARGLEFTPHEIFQQPQTWHLTSARVRNSGVQITDLLDRFRLQTDCTTRGQVAVRLIGAGTSDYVGRAVRALLSRQWQWEVTAVPSTDLLTNPQDWILGDQQYLWIWFSRSGESPESVASLEQVLGEHPSIRHIVITCNDRGQLAHRFEADQRVLSIILDESVNDRGLAMTSSFSNMVVAAQVLAHIRSLESYDGILEEIVSAATIFRGCAAEACASLAAQGYSRMCFLGTGALKAVAQECALKVLELTAGRVQTLAHSSLGIRHGPLSALDQETLVVSFLSSDAGRRGYELDLLAEILSKNLSRTTVAIVPAEVAGLVEVAEQVVPLQIRNCPDEYRPPIDAIFGQLLGLFSSLEHGLKPDDPSPNGAISRVVSRVRIHPR